MNYSSWAGRRWSWFHLVFLCWHESKAFTHVETSVAHFWRGWLKTFARDIIKDVTERVPIRKQKSMLLVGVSQLMGERKEIYRDSTTWSVLPRLQSCRVWHASEVDVNKISIREAYLSGLPGKRVCKSTICVRDWVIDKFKFGCQRVQ